MKLNSLSSLPKRSLLFLAPMIFAWGLRAQTVQKDSVLQGSLFQQEGIYSASSKPKSKPTTDSTFSLSDLGDAAGKNSASEIYLQMEKLRDQLLTFFKGQENDSVVVGDVELLDPANAGGHLIYEVRIRDGKETFYVIRQEFSSVFILSHNNGWVWDNKDRNRIVEYFAKREWMEKE